MRFRKSINLGGGFRINLSKSGVGYSWGTKGYRKTKTARGITRSTVSIPNTGLSYVSENGKNEKRNTTKQTPNVNKVENNNYDFQEIKNGTVKNMVSDGLEEMLESANKALLLRNSAIWTFFITLFIGFAFPFVLLLSAIAAFVWIYVSSKGIIELAYIFEDEQANEVSQRMSPLQKIAKSKKLWWISQTSKVIDKKYASGASNSIKRNKCTSLKKVPFPFKTGETFVALKSGRKTLLFLPDKLFVFQGSKIGALNYTDVKTSVHGQRFIETETVPSDAKIIDYTWQYVNKSGGPDKRFRKNRKLPVCHYGEMEIRSDKGINTDIMFSNIEFE